MQKKILIVTYYWFPSTGTGTYRISKFVKYLKRAGWNPVILTAQEPSGTYRDSDLEPIYRDIPVYRTGFFEPTKYLHFFSGKKSSAQKTTSVDPSIFYARNRSIKEKLAAWVRLNLFVPDAKIFWKHKAVQAGKEVIRKEQPRLILSTAPPPTAQLVARDLARWSSLPWLADFRDPWTNIYYYEDHPPNALADRINRRMETSVLREADTLTVVNAGFFPGTDIAHKTVKITNGYDRDDLPDKPVQSPGPFIMRYLGSLKLNQYPEHFIGALRRISQDAPDRARAMKLEMYGKIDASIRKELLRDDILVDVSFHGYVSHDRSIELMAESDLLLLFIGRSESSKLVLSTKIFEYMMVRKPVLGVGHPDGSAAEVVRETGIGQFFSHDQKKGLAEYIHEVYDCREKGTDCIKPNEEAIAGYDFQQLSGRLEQELLNLLEEQSHASA